jgi:benzil reductase ((S)-benzoin forming)
MPTHLTILTGASRGMGLALAQQILHPGSWLLTIARQPATSLEQVALQAGARLTQWSADLAEPSPVSERLERWLAQLPPGELASATLINNAGLIPPLVALRDASAQAQARALRVGLEAPMLLSAAFLRATRDWALPRKVLNISSGLGRRAMASSSAYCAAKAGMDHFTRCLALEEAASPHGARVCSLAPGVIDTDMQTQLRSAGAADFPDRGNFASLKEKGQLASPAEAARRVLAYLARPDFGAEPVADVRG